MFFYRDMKFYVIFSIKTIGRIVDILEIDIKEFFDNDLI